MEIRLFHPFIILLLAYVSVHPFTLNPIKRRGVVLFDSDRSDVQIFDNVFPPEKCKKLHHLAVDHADRCESSFVDRFSSNKKTPLEECLHQVLKELGDDTTPFIEYWARDEYMNIDVHCDIDERELENEGLLRYPHKSHILYLEISSHGPTCVFPSQRGGWSSQESVELLTIPAVQGRLLVFDGNMMHAVPKPPNRWLLTKEQQEVVDKEELEYEDEEYYDDYDEEAEFEVERSVILFNTWTERPPLDVLPDTSNNLIPDGIEIVGDYDFFTEIDNDIDEKELRCNPRISWTQNPLGGKGENNSEEKSHLTISLMGKKSRRTFPDKFATLIGCKEKISLAVSSDRDSSSLLIDGC